MGDVYNGDGLVARVRFSLSVIRQRNGSGPSSGTEEPPRLKDIRGVITVLAGERHLVEGTTLVLQLADGSQWEFVVQSGNFISGEYVAVGTGKQDIIPL